MVDILAITAHPDDIELCCAGTLLKAQDAGRTIAACDVTEGERGTRGTRETRRAETASANKVLGLDDTTRINLGIPDGDIQITKENILSVVRVIRHFRPSVLLFPWERDRHPDHEHVHRLVREAYFDAGLVHVETDWNGEQQQPHRPERMYNFFHTYERIPDFIVDISAQMERKLQSIAAYTSQVTMPNTAPDSRHADEPETFISRPKFIESALARWNHWGFMIGTEYGEGFCTVGPPLKINDLMDTL